jgi:hypothetical protein
MRYYLVEHRELSNDAFPPVLAFERLHIAFVSSFGQIFAAQFMSTATMLSDRDTAPATSEANRSRDAKSRCCTEERFPQLRTSVQTLPGFPQSLKEQWR